MISYRNNKMIFKHFRHKMFNYLKKDNENFMNEQAVKDFIINIVDNFIQ